MLPQYIILAKKNETKASKVLWPWSISLVFTVYLWSEAMWRENCETNNIPWLFFYYVQIYIVCSTNIVSIWSKTIHALLFYLTRISMQILHLLQLSMSFIAVFFSMKALYFLSHSLSFSIQCKYCVFYSHLCHFLLFLFNLNTEFVTNKLAMVRQWAR